MEKGGNGFDDDVESNEQDDDADDLGAEAFDVGVSEFFVGFQGSGFDFFADHDDDAGKSVNQAVQRIREDRQGAGD